MLVWILSSKELSRKNLRRRKYRSRGGNKPNTRKWASDPETKSGKAKKTKKKKHNTHNQKRKKKKKKKKPKKTGSS